MTEQIRELGPDDLEQEAELGRLVFGGAPGGPAEPRAPGERSWGVLDKGRLLAAASVRSYRQWWGGRAVPMAGVAGVGVHPDARGRGAARRLVSALLPEMTAAGHPLSVLFPTAAGIYRSLGWELAGSLDELRLPTSALLQARPAPGPDAVRVRSAGLDDVPAVERLWWSYGSTTQGLLTRDGPSFPRGGEPVLEHDVVALAEQDGAAVGYLSYDRGRGYGPGAELRVWEMVTQSRHAAAELLRSVGSWDAAAPAVSWRGPVDDLALALGVNLPPPYARRPWMLRVLDAPAAVAARGFPPPVTVTQERFTLVDPHVPGHEGSWRLSVSQGSGELSRVPAGDGPRLHVRGLAMLWAGAGPSVLLRAGLLDRPADGLAAAFAGPAPMTLDYF